MENRIVKANISAAGGTAAKGAKTCKVTLPNAWLDQMGITSADRELQLSFDGQTITIRKNCTCEIFLQSKLDLGHHVKKLSFFDEHNLCSVVYADFSDQTLSVKNYVNDPVKTAFGICCHPTWDDFLMFLESRCISRHRAGLKYYLQELHLDEYDPISIIQKTEGRMAEDQQWLKVEEAMP